MKKTILIIVALMVSMAFASGAQAADETEIQAAIDLGLEWLAGKQTSDGYWNVMYRVGATALAVKKFEHDAMLREYESPFDPAYPYHGVVEAGFEYIFKHAHIVAIYPYNSNDPDTDGDSIGVCFYTPATWHPTYETGIALMAIAECMTPDRVVNDPESAVDGWTYYDVAVDVMNWLVFAQIDAGARRGSWGYQANGGGDQSNSGYATLGLAFAEAGHPEGFGLTIPQFVKDDLSDPGLWIDYIQNDVDGDQYDGGSGYFNPDDTLPWYQTVNILETGNLLFEMAWCEDQVGDTRVDDAIDYVVRHWTDGGYNWPGPQGWHGNYQAMYTMMKGLEALEADIIGGIDWFDEVSDTIVATQHPSGSWGPDVWDNWVSADSVLSTTWALLTLQKVTIPPPIKTVYFDIKPTSCPNPLNVKMDRFENTAPEGEDIDVLLKPNPGIKKPNAVLPVAILGTEEFDVATVDPATVILEGVSPIRWSYEDVSTPVGEGAEECECTTWGPDGYMDMTLKFRSSEIVAAIGEVEDGDIIVLTIAGMLFDSTAFHGTDCVIIIDGGKAFATGDLTDPELEGNYPNPFNPSTEIFFYLPDAMHVKLVVYNLMGQEIATLANDYMHTGRHSVIWDGKAAASGVYFYRLTAGSVVDTRKMVLLK
jgi:hypothetical protein